jgi:ABC-type nitrate/sulfonate/bicarbonate transport system ATPase subunit
MIRHSAHPQAPGLEVVDLGKSFLRRGERLEVLREVSLTVPPGGFVSLLGPSGCGKSTLLEIVAGLAAADRGAVRLDGQEVRGAGAAGYMPQRDHLLPWRSLLQNVMLGPELRGQSGPAAEREARELLTRFGLAGFEANYPATLSGGMRQRGALLRTVMYEPRWLLLDEPLSALDALTRLELQDWLARLVATLGSSVLLVTHDIREALLLSDVIYLLSERPATVRGRFVVPGSRPRAALELTSPAMVQLEGALMSALLVKA